MVQQHLFSSNLETDLHPSDNITPSHRQDQASPGQSHMHRVMQLIMLFSHPHLFYHGSRLARVTFLRYSKTAVKKRLPLYICLNFLMKICRTQSQSCCCSPLCTFLTRRTTAWRHLAAERPIAEPFVNYP